MSFDGIFLNQLITELKACESGRISKIIDSGDTDFIFTIRSEKKNLNLMISLSSDFSRIHFTTKNYDAPKTPKSFTMLLRKHIEGFFIERISQYGSDRILSIELAGYNEMRDYTHKYLICEIMGRYSNLILTDQDFKIIEVLKRDGVGEFHRTMLPNATYEYPKTDKLNPLTMTLDQILAVPIQTPKDLVTSFNGVSMLLAEACFQTEQVQENFYNALRADIQPVIIKTRHDKQDFYYAPLNNEIITEYETISDLLDQYYYTADTAAKIKLKTNDLLSFVDKQIIKNEKKIIKLKKESLNALNADNYRIMGELLLSCQNLKQKESEIEIYNYYTNEFVVIPLDKKIDIISNSQKYYKKYQKSKSAIHYIDEQIQKAEQEIAYFKLLKYQLSNCSLNDALEIKQELIDGRYMQAAKENKSKKPKISLLTFIVDTVLISVGKNNIQNEYLTHKLSKPNDYWFHVKDGSGSHVVVHTSELSEALIRYAANLAAVHSTFHASSSVPVDYTQIRNIKKIPGQRACFVTYTKQKTIYIDPDKLLIENMKVKK